MYSYSNIHQNINEVKINSHHMIWGVMTWKKIIQHWLVVIAYHKSIKKKKIIGVGTPVLGSLSLFKYNMIR